MAIVEFDNCAIRADKIVYVAKSDLTPSLDVGVEGAEQPLRLNFPTTKMRDEAFFTIRKGMLGTKQEVSLK